MNRFVTYVLCGLLAPLLAQGPVPASGGAGGSRQAHFSIKKYFGPQLPQSSLNDQPKKKRVAIIGAGIGGASAGHFLTKFTQGQTPGVSEEFDVDIFEKGDRVGGRVYSRFFGSDPEKFELGANAFVDVNYNLVNATRDYNITFKDNVGGNSSIGLYNGQDFTIKLDDTYYSKAAFYYRYGWGMFKAQRFARTVRDQFLAIYDESVPPFASVEEAMERTKLTEYLYKTTRDVLVNEWSAGPVFADELLQAFTRNIYGSDGELHALAGGISLIAVAGSYTTENGNDQFIKAYLQSSAPTVKLHLNSPITKITRVPGDAIGGLWNRYQLDVNGSSNNVTYDAVILASPFDQASLDLRNFELPNVDLPKYRNIYVAVIQEADVNPVYFGAKEIEEIPNVVFGFNATANTPFTVFTHDTVSKIITIEATKPLSLLNLQPMIQGTLDKSQVTFKNWLAYPRMALKKKTEPMFPPIRVAPSFYYVNAIESAISCMEVEIVSARNIARLLMDDLLEI